VAEYFELRGFEHLYLEDSYVLAIREDADELRFELEAVLTQNHPRWTPPKPEEHYAYLRVDLVFAHPREVEWLNRSERATVDPDGAIDYGNIDTFTWEDTRFELVGDWGHVRIEADPPAIVER
jgi:hypothetical protein